VGQGVPAAGRDGVQVLGDAGGVPGRLPGAQGGRAVGRRGRVQANRERDRVRGHAGQRPVAGRSARRRAGHAGSHVRGTGRPQRRVRDTVGAVGAAARARPPGGHRTQQARAARAGTVAVHRRAARRRAHHQQHAVILVHGARKEVEVFEHLTRIICYTYTHTYIHIYTYKYVSVRYTSLPS